MRKSPLTPLNTVVAMPLAMARTVTIAPCTGAPSAPTCPVKILLPAIAGLANAAHTNTAAMRQSGAFMLMLCLPVNLFPFGEFCQTKPYAFVQMLVAVRTATSKPHDGGTRAVLLLLPGRNYIPLSQRFWTRRA